MARRRRPGRGCRRRRPARPGRRRLARRHGPAGRPAGALASCAQPLALRAPTRLRLRGLAGMSSSRFAGRARTGSRKADQPAVEAAGREGRGRGGRPRSGPDASLIRRLGAVPRRQRKRAASGPDGAEAWGVVDCRPAPSRASGRAAAPSATGASPRRFPTPRPSLERLLSAFRSRSRRPQGRDFRRFAWRLGRASESCPIRQAYRTSPLPRQAGRIQRHNVTKRRQGFTMAK